jgi:hypothetical protein
MTTRTWKFVALTVVIVSLGILVLGQKTRAQAPQSTPNRTVSSQGNGRFQIVNGTPDLTRNIMLLDTETGDSWILCVTGDNSDGWCRMQRSNNSSEHAK